MNLKGCEKQRASSKSGIKVNLLGRTAANRYDLQPRQFVQGPRFKLGTSRIGSRKTIRSTWECGYSEFDDYYIAFTLATSQYIFTIL
jgi:hypothetical protein